jgi:hypothetical protein
MRSFALTGVREAGGAAIGKLSGAAMGSHGMAFSKNRAPSYDNARIVAGERIVTIFPSRHDTGAVQSEKATCSHQEKGLIIL